VCGGRGFNHCDTQIKCKQCKGKGKASDGLPCARCGGKGFRGN
jgi:RecJ-like exonuclease